jgi:hypothetical protein
MITRSLLAASEEVVDLAIDELDARLRQEEGHASVLTYLFF